MTLVYLYWGVDNPTCGYAHLVSHYLCSCCFYVLNYEIVFIFLFSFIFFCSSWYLTEIKIYNNQLDQGTSPPSPYPTWLNLVLMLHMNILLYFSFKTYIWEYHFLTLRTMFGLGLGGMYIDFYLFVLFCFVVLKKKFILPSLRFMFWVRYTTLD